ncbi:adenosylmethionine--8-amino-7-oxononanoate transaminase [Vibrio tritonius]|uniref:adenosylmethionine--8-amino-7-oxononanoate transaminase n=1 Tax=Vibrio tritonius TaxID=1435069 RepID=UPI00315DBB3A
MDLSFDRQHIWHPYTSTTTPLTCYPASHAEGVHIYLEDGRVLVDGMSSWWCAIHGYGHQRLKRAAQAQIEKMSHVMFGGLTHQPAIDVCRKLIELTPEPLDKVFLADSGSVAVEVSLKMALQYWNSRGENRSQFLTIRHGYHGDTFAAMSVTDPDNSMHSLYRGFLPQHLFAKEPSNGFFKPWDNSEIDDFAQQLANHHHNIAAVIMEPIVQGAIGMRIYHPHFLREVRRLCDQYGVLLILDEIATGFGRTGKCFAFEHADIIPDILCVGKALTGGFMTLSAVITTKTIADTVSGGPAGCFMHGPTFMANPLACAVASESLTMISEGDWQANVARIEAVFAQELPKFALHSRVKDVRWLGAIGVVETNVPVNMEAIQALFVEQGVWIRPFGCLIYLMPPFISEDQHLHVLLNAIALALDTPECFINAR